LPLLALHVSIYSLTANFHWEKKFHSTKSYYPILYSPHQWGRFHLRRCSNAFSATATVTAASDVTATDDYATGTAAVAATATAMVPLPPLPMTSIPPLPLLVMPLLLVSHLDSYLATLASCTLPPSQETMPGLK
jgi:hypothetical protein